MQNPTEFAEGLIKGKIAEIIFTQMFRAEGKYSVIPFGYENLIPSLIGCGRSGEAKRVKKISVPRLTSH